MTFLIKATNEYRVETKEHANKLHKELETFCGSNGYTLVSWSETYKSRKAQGEIIDEYYQIKATIQFNDIKEPEIVLDSIDYNMGGQYE